MSEPGTFFHVHEEDPVLAYENFKLGMWIFLATEVLLFGGLFAAYFILKFKWPAVFEQGATHLNPWLGGLNTIILLCSSYSMAMAVDSAQRGRNAKLKFNLLATLVFAAGFIVVKAFEWTPKINHGIVPGSDVFFSVYYMTTGLHLLHVLVGMFFIALIFFRATKNHYNQTNFGGVEVGGLYWHLVDVIWIFLFPLLYLI